MMMVLSSKYTLLWVMKYCHNFDNSDNYCKDRCSYSNLNNSYQEKKKGKNKSIDLKRRKWVGKKL